MQNDKKQSFAGKPWWIITAAVLLAVAGCATPPGAGPGGTTAAPAAIPAAPPPAAAAEPPKPAPGPELTPAQAKAQAQKHAIEAVDQLQNGDEAGARQTLDQALTLDPANELAKNLRDQILADPQKELGSVFFRYTVQRDDSMSKLAQLYLGDRFRFYILARYNEIPNPSRLAAGQVIKIPGKGPIAPPAATARPGRETAEPARASEPEVPAPPPTPQVDAKALVAKGQQMQKSGDLEGAYAAFSDAAKREPGNREAVTQRDAVKTILIRRYEREAVQAFQRQNLDVAIARWTSVLDLDPNNQKARLERDRAADLKKRITEKFGG